MGNELSHGVTEHQPGQLDRRRSVPLAAADNLTVSGEQKSDLQRASNSSNNVRHSLTCHNTASSDIATYSTAQQPVAKPRNRAKRRSVDPQRSNGPPPTAAGDLSTGRLLTDAADSADREEQSARPAKALGFEQSLLPEEQRPSSPVLDFERPLGVTGSESELVQLQKQQQQQCCPADSGIESTSIPHCDQQQSTRAASFYEFLGIAPDYLDKALSLDIRFDLEAAETVSSHRSGEVYREQSAYPESSQIPTAAAQSAVTRQIVICQDIWDISGESLSDYDDNEESINETMEESQLCSTVKSPRLDNEKGATLNTEIRAESEDYKTCAMASAQRSDDDAAGVLNGFEVTDHSSSKMEFNAHSWSHRLDLPTDVGDQPIEKAAEETTNNFEGCGSDKKFFEEASAHETSSTEHLLRNHNSVVIEDINSNKVLPAFGYYDAFGYDDASGERSSGSVIDLQSPGYTSEISGSIRVAGYMQTEKDHTDPLPEMGAAAAETSEENGDDSHAISSSSKAPPTAAAADADTAADAAAADADTAADAAAAADADTAAGAAAADADTAAGAAADADTADDTVSDTADDTVSDAAAADVDAADDTVAGIAAADFDAAAEAATTVAARSDGAAGTQTIKFADRQLASVTIDKSSVETNVSFNDCESSQEILSFDNVTVCPSTASNGQEQQQHVQGCRESTSATISISGPEPTCEPANQPPSDLPAEQSSSITDRVDGVISTGGDCYNETVRTPSLAVLLDPVEGTSTNEGAGDESNAQCINGSSVNSAAQQNLLAAVNDAETVSAQTSDSKAVSEGYHRMHVAHHIGLSSGETDGSCREKNSYEGETVTAKSSSRSSTDDPERSSGVPPVLINEGYSGGSGTVNNFMAEPPPETSDLATQVATNVIAPSSTPAAGSPANSTVQVLRIRRARVVQTGGAVFGSLTTGSSPAKSVVREAPAPTIGFAANSVRQNRPQSDGGDRLFASAPASALRQWGLTQCPGDTGTVDSALAERAEIASSLNFTTAMETAQSSAKETREVAGKSVKEKKHEDSFIVERTVESAVAPKFLSASPSSLVTDATGLARADATLVARSPSHSLSTTLTATSQLQSSKVRLGAQPFLRSNSLPAFKPLGKLFSPTSPVSPGISNVSDKIDEQAETAGALSAIQCSTQEHDINGLVEAAKSESAVTEQVESAVTEQVESAVTEQVESAVTEQVESAVTEQVESAATEQVDCTVDTARDEPVLQAASNTLRGEVDLTTCDETHKDTPEWSAIDEKSRKDDATPDKLVLAVNGDMAVSIECMAPGDTGLDAFTEPNGMTTRTDAFSGANASCTTHSELPPTDSASRSLPSILPRDTATEANAAAVPVASSFVTTDDSSWNTFSGSDEVKSGAGHQEIVSDESVNGSSVDSAEHDTVGTKSVFEYTAEASSEVSGPPLCKQSVSTQGTVTIADKNTNGNVTDSIDYAAIRRGVHARPMRKASWLVARSYVDDDDDDDDDNVSRSSASQVKAVGQDELTLEGVEKERLDIINAMKVRRKTVDLKQDAAAVATAAPANAPTAGRHTIPNRIRRLSLDGSKHTVQIRSQPTTIVLRRPVSDLVKTLQQSSTNNEQ